jgi:hypothetical protein
MTPHRWLIAVGLAACLAVAGPARPRAATKVDLALVLAVDASRSIDTYEYGLQRNGYAKALSHPDVIRAITSGEYGRIALAYVEWSSSSQQTVLVAWAVIDGADAARRFVKALQAAPRRFSGATSVSGAIDFSVPLFASSGVEATRRVIDISGDGPNNSGRPSVAARDDAVRAGFTINGLAILNDRPSRPPWPEEAVDRHYRTKVIGGPGAFMMVVENFEAFAIGIRQKLVREIAARPGTPPGTRSGTRPIPALIRP